VASVTGLVLGHQAAEHDIATQVQQLAGPEGGKAVAALFETSRNTTHGILATAFGLLTLLFGASGVLIELRDALNTIWEVPNPELSLWKKVSAFAKERLFSFALVLAIGFLLIVSLAISAFISAVGALSASLLPADEFVLHAREITFAFGEGFFFTARRFGASLLRES
jgi:membrane protein